MIFRIATGCNPSLTTLHQFFLTGIGGDRPQAELTEASDGFIYGTTEIGGLNGNGAGTVFRFAKAGVPNCIHQWAGTAISSIASDPNGKVYVFGSTSVTLGNPPDDSGTFFVARFNPDLTADATFGGAGGSGFLQFGPFSSVGSLARIAVDAVGSSFLSGNTDQNISPFLNQGGTDVFVTRFDSCGNLPRWTDVRHPGLRYGN